MTRLTSSKHTVNFREELSEDEDVLQGSSRDFPSDANSEEVYSSENDDSTQASSQSGINRNGDKSESESDSSKELQQATGNFSFGALARAQETLTLGKRKRETEGPISGATAPDNDRHRKSKVITKGIPTVHRSSKHAPMVQSSKRPVSRTLSVFTTPSTAQARDPRFDAAVMTSSRTSASHSNKAYAFLADYRSSELSTLRAQIKKAKDPQVIASLKKQAMSLESKIKAAETKAQADEIRRKHRKKEQMLIREGKKHAPFFLKDSEVKREIRTRQVEGMGAKQRDRREKKKRKKEAGKQMKAIPGRRRENIEEDHVPDS